MACASPSARAGCRTRKPMVARITGGQKKAGPRKPLAAHIGSCYQKKLPAPEIEALIERLIHNRQISISGTALTCHF